ncbi:MarR family transcriptional regulator [Croceicoccus marinus]|jgi:DNA-binding NarL/FixJ family response regulator|uniref:MarR family transcriptional regulator n=1 Tax=Croceicoccus marinus TaxID=450378 RepID=A0A7G6VQM2_9SPHN|nr:MarR family transcriptional regulator [Croceicoccus marinus]QNE04037.1 MarR family transcriptional regulator [Croceicoccus marinus]
MQIAQPFVFEDGDEPMAGAELASVPVSVLSDRPRIRAELVDQLLEAGLLLRQADPLDRLLSDEAFVLGDIVVIDIPAPGAEFLAALARLDARAAQSGTQLVVSTKVEAIDAVFGAMDCCDVQFLIDPSPAEYALAIGAALARLPGRSVHELAREDQLALVRLTEQVHSLARKLGGMPMEVEAPDQLRSPSFAYMAFPSTESPRGSEGKRAERKLPSASLLREMIRQRQLRASFFEGELFADPAWDMLLDLTAARAEGNEVCVSSLCIASGVPATTALRWIGQMTEAGLFERLPDPADRRRAIIRLSQSAQDAMCAYFARVGPSVVAI